MIIFIYEARVTRIIIVSLLVAIGKRNTEFLSSSFGGVILLLSTLLPPRQVHFPRKNFTNWMASKNRRSFQSLVGSKEGVLCYSSKMDWDSITMANLHLTATEHRYYGDIFIYCCENADSDSVSVVKVAELLRSANLPRDVTMKVSLSFYLLFKFHLSYTTARY